MHSGRVVTAAHDVNPGNVDTAVFNDVFSDYDINLFGKDDEGFITIDHARAGAAIVGGNPQGLLGGDDGTDRIRNIERLQFTDITVSIDADGNILTSSDGRFLDPVFGESGSDPFYDAVPVGTPDDHRDRRRTAPSWTPRCSRKLATRCTPLSQHHRRRWYQHPVALQWQVQDFLSGVWLPIVGATGADFKITTFQDGNPLRVAAHYTDAKGVQESVFSAPTILVTLPGNVNTPPFVVPQQQLNGIPSTTALFNQPFDYFVPLTTIFNDGQTLPVNLVYTATLADGSSLASANLSFTYTPDPVALTGFGEFKTLCRWAEYHWRDRHPGHCHGYRSRPAAVGHQHVLHQRGAAEQPAGRAQRRLQRIQRPDLTVLPQGVLSNDSDPNADPFTASLVAGPAHGTLALKADGSFTYLSNALYVGPDTFTYHDTDSAGAVGNTATVTINVVNFDIPPVASAAAESSTASKIRRSAGSCCRGRTSTARCSTGTALRY